MLVPKEAKVDRETKEIKVQEVLKDPKVTKVVLTDIEVLKVVLGVKEPKDTKAHLQLVE